MIDSVSRACDGVRSEAARPIVPTVSIEKALHRNASVYAGNLFSVPKAFGLTEQERELFLRIVADALRIQRHYQLFLWLQGEFQAFVPHAIFIGAWGDFSRPKLHADLISGLPGVRTSGLTRCHIDALLQDAHARWLGARRMPVIYRMENSAVSLKPSCGCPIHEALQGMHSIVAHGVSDARGGPDNLYLALHTGSLAQGRPQERVTSLLDALIAPIDVAFGKIGTLPLANGRAARGSSGNWLDISTREQEILDLVCSGKTNVEIASTLSISPFTVKNHVQRIFRKIGATNRTEAAAKYNQAQRAIDQLL